MEKSIIENIANWYMPLDENNVEFFFWTFFSLVHFIFIPPTYFVDRFAPEIVSKREEKNIFLVFALKMTNFDENV
jgi:hypothetical protein